MGNATAGGTGAFKYGTEELASKGSVLGVHLDPSQGHYSGVLVVSPHLLQNYNPQSQARRLRVNVGGSRGLPAEGVASTAESRGSTGR